MLSFIAKYRHTNWALADQAMVSSVNFLTGILFARYLGLEEYGRFTLAWMAVLLFSSFQQAGIIAPMMSIGPKQKKEDMTSYYGTIFVHQLLWSTGCFFLLWFVVWSCGFVFPEWNTGGLALPLAVSLFAWQFQDFIRRYFFVTGQLTQAFLNDAISYLGQLLLLLFLFRIMVLNTPMVLWLISGTSALAIIVGLYKISFASITRTMFNDISKKHWHFSKWMVASAMMQWISGNFYLVIAGTLLGPVAVGGVKAAQNIMGVTHILFQAMENFAPSQATKELSRGGISAMAAYLRKLTLIGTAATAAFALIAFCIPGFLLSLLYGNEFGAYAFVLRWFCLIYISSFLALPLNAGLRALGKTKPLFFSVFSGGIFSLFSAYPFIYFFKLNGLMMGLLSAKVLMTIYLYHSLTQFYLKDRTIVTR